MKPRPYQLEALTEIKRELSEKRSTLLVMATGLGKTICFSMLAKDMLNFGKVLVLAHREELIFQASQKLYSVTGRTPAIEMGIDHVTQNRTYQPDIIVSTIQTQIAGMSGQGRMTKFDPNDFSLLVIDEAHHTAASSYRKVIDYYTQNPNIKILGVTATPDRADEKALGQIFDSCAYQYEILDGIDDGWLVPISQQAVYVEGLDYSQIRTTAGDLNGADLSEVMELEDNLHRIASPTLEITGSMKTLLFAASVKQAERLCEILNRSKPNSAAFIYAKTPDEERRYLVKSYHEGKYQYLCNCGIATEGFDCPEIECVILARPTKSRSLYSQMCGRGTRPLPNLVDGLEDPEARKKAIVDSGKPKLLVVDFVGNSGRHKLITSTDILGGRYEDEVVELARKNIEKKGVPADVSTELELAEQQIKREREKKERMAERAKVLVAAKYRTVNVNPFDVLDIQPRREREWDKFKKVSLKQLDLLTKFGLQPNPNMTFIQAHQLIGNLIARRKKNLCTYKQAKLLKSFGYNTENMTFDLAGILITKLKSNGWKKTGELIQL